MAEAGIGAAAADLPGVGLDDPPRQVEGALARSGATLADVSFLCGLHTKRSMHDELVRRLTGESLPMRTVTSCAAQSCGA